MKTILVTGSGGQLGKAFKRFSKPYKEHKFIFASHDELDITNKEHVISLFRDKEVNICINCAAYTKVDQAEQDQETANLINTTAIEYLTEASLKQRATLVHFSTDFVFNGMKSSPYNESDDTAPLGTYGASKLAGEQYLLENHPHSLIFRTSWVYSNEGSNFLNTMKRLGAERDLLKVIFDQAGTPTYTEDLAQAVLTILFERDLQGNYGLYHYSNEGICSWYDFAKAIMDECKLDCEVLPIETKDYPTPAKRPAFSVLNKAKVKETFDLKIPYWRDSLWKCLNE